jgi:HSP20 family protein
MKRREDPYKDNDWFGGFLDFDEEFRSMRERMEQMFGNRGESLSEGFENSDPNVRFYGYNMSMGPDGVPHVKEFGNFQPRRPGELPDGPLRPVPDGPGPPGGPSCRPMRRITNGLRGQDDDRFVDIQDCGGELRITVELPGVEKEQIGLELVEDNVLHLMVDTERKKVDKDIPLPNNVMPESIKAKCKNGVLEVTMAKKEEVKKKTTKVDIE